MHIWKYSSYPPDMCAQAHTHSHIRDEFSSTSYACAQLKDSLKLVLWDLEKESICQNLCVCVWPYYLNTFKLSLCSLLCFWWCQTAGKKLFWAAGNWSKISRISLPVSRAQILPFIVRVLIYFCMWACVCVYMFEPSVISCYWLQTRHRFNRTNKCPVCKHMPMCTCD